MLETVLDLAPESLTKMAFMSCSTDLTFEKANIIVSRCGYTGEDGFEVSVPNERAVSFMESLLAVQDAQSGKQVAECVGLGARDSLRLEAGLCLYGSDISETTSPIEAMLAWTISKRRR